MRRDGFGGERADIDLQWTVAEAYARMKQTEEAVNIYRSILRTSIDPRERIATIRRRWNVCASRDVEPLFEEFKAGRKRPQRTVAARHRHHARADQRLPA